MGAARKHNHESITAQGSDHHIRRGIEEYNTTPTKLRKRGYKYNLPLSCEAGRNYSV